MKKKLPLSYIEINKENLIHNFKALKYIAKKSKIICVIKGNAYGHGQKEIVKIIEPITDYFQVNSLSELKLLRKISNKKTFILGYIQKNDLKDAIKLGSILSVFSIEKLKEINELSRILNVKQEIHVAIDAYLGREGLLKEDLIKFLKELKSCDHVFFSGVYAHFANIEDTNNFSHAKKQIKKFEEVLKLINRFGFKNIKTHISATSGLLVYEVNKKIKKNHSFVRLGIGIYGLWPSSHIKYLYSPINKKDKRGLELRPVLSWKTKIAQIKEIPKGHTIGYGLTYMTYISTKIAIVPVGYADGYDRSLSNTGSVLIRGTRCNVLGRISMNMFVVDVNHLQDLSIDEEVVLIGKQKEDEITVEEIAKKIDSINYEVVTRISPLLPRVII